MDRPSPCPWPLRRRRVAPAAPHRAAIRTACLLPASHGFFVPRTAGRSPYTPGELALLALAGLAIALAGVLGLAIWAAAAKTTTALLVAE